MRVCDLVFGHESQPSAIRAWAISPGCRQAPKGASFRKRYGLILLNVLWRTVFVQLSAHRLERINKQAVNDRLFAFVSCFAGIIWRACTA